MRRLCSSVALSAHSGIVLTCLDSELLTMPDVGQTSQTDAHMLPRYRYREFGDSGMKHELAVAALNLVRASSRTSAMSIAPVSSKSLGGTVRQASGKANFCSSSVAHVLTCS